MKWVGGWRKNSAHKQQKLFIESISSFKDTTSRFSNNSLSDDGGKHGKNKCFFLRAKMLVCSRHMFREEEKWRNDGGGNIFNTYFHFGRWIDRSGCINAFSSNNTTTLHAAALISFLSAQKRSFQLQQKKTTNKRYLSFFHSITGWLAEKESDGSDVDDTCHAMPWQADRSTRQGLNYEACKHANLKFMYPFN